MASQLLQKLTRLGGAAMSKGHFAVAAAADHLSRALDDVDRQIDLVGALHEVGSLKNTLRPYWTEFLAHEPPWIERCVARLRGSAHAYWAVAALLGSPAARVVAAATGAGLWVFAVRQYERWDEPPVRVASLCAKREEQLLSPLLEVGWDTVTEQVVDVARARAVWLRESAEVSGSLVGEGSAHCFLRATLPHGSWRSVELPFAIARETVVPGASPRLTFRGR